MADIDRREFLVLAAGSVGMVRAATALHTLLEPEGCTELDPETRWMFSPHGEGVKSHTSQFIKMLARAPEDVTFAMCELGRVIDAEQEDQTNVLVFFEAKPKAAMTAELAHSLMEIGYRPFREFPMASVLAQLDQMNAEGGLVV